MCSDCSDQAIDIQKEELESDESMRTGVAIDLT